MSVLLGLECDCFIRTRVLAFLSGLECEYFIRTRA